LVQENYQEEKACDKRNNNNNNNSGGGGGGSVEKEVKIINWEQDFLYTTE